VGSAATSSQLANGQLQRLSRVIPARPAHHWLRGHRCFGVSPPGSCWGAVVSDGYPAFEASARRVISHRMRFAGKPLCRPTRGRDPWWGRRSLEQYGQPGTYAGKTATVPIGITLQFNNGNTSGHKLVGWQREGGLTNFRKWRCSRMARLSVLTASAPISVNGFHGDRAASPVFGFGDQTQGFRWSARSAIGQRRFNWGTVGSRFAQLCLEPTSLPDTNRDGDRPFLRTIAAPELLDAGPPASARDLGYGPAWAPP